MAGSHVTPSRSNILPSLVLRLELEPELFWLELPPPPRYDEGAFTLASDDLVAAAAFSWFAIFSRRCC